jgi:ABC-type uncharacterized transport system substrate-binding protein
VLVDAFRQELGKLGWIEGKNLSIDYRFAENKGRDRLAELAAEMVLLKVDLIVVTSGPAASVAKGAATTIPIVVTSSVDPPVFLRKKADRRACREIPIASYLFPKRVCR